jgi:uncharacterized phiE125 gp8 family phage protein
MSLTNTTSGSVTEPVTYSDLEAHGRIPTGEQSYLEALISTSRMAAEHETGQVIPQQQFTWITNDFENGMALPVYPVRTIGSITYLDADGASQTLASSVYEVVTDKLVTRLYLKPNQDWPDLQSDAYNRITVVINAGMETVPENLKLAIKMIAATAYDNRQDEIVGEAGHIKVDQASKFFLRPYVRHTIG